VDDEIIFSEKFLVHGFTLPLLLLILARNFSANSLVSALYSVIAWVKGCFHMQCCLVFSAPALNLVIALFQPGWGHLLTIRSGNVAVTNLRVKIMSVVSTTKVSDIFPIPQYTFQTKQAHLVSYNQLKQVHNLISFRSFVILSGMPKVKQSHLVVYGEADFLLPCSLFPLGFQGGPAKEVGVSLELASE